MRGAFLRIWYTQKIKKVEDVYLKEAVRASGIAKKPSNLPSLVANPLRKLVLIADMMWEKSFLVPELQKVCEVEYLDFRSSLEQAQNEQPADVALTALKAFLKKPRDREPDVILLYARSPLLSEELFSMLRKHWRCPLLGMQLDDKVNLLRHRIFSDRNDDYLRWVSYFDLNLTNGLVVTDWYRERGFPVHYFPQGFLNENLNPPDLDAAYVHELSFLGSIKPDRERIVNRLRNAGIPIALFGKGWSDSKWVDNPTSVYRASQINLGIGYATPNLTTIKGRDFECPGTGACYLTTYNWELSNWFEIGKEILMYREVEELIEIFSYYRRRPEACAKIARAAYLRCANEHTWEKRFRKLFSELGFQIR